jgi:acyl-CoA synthetase (AMP-forming)/AMP-acid ligase II
VTRAARIFAPAISAASTDGELFLVGRMKELIIVRGRNVPPQDIEEAVAGAHDALRAGHVAAVGLRRTPAGARRSSPRSSASTGARSIPSGRRRDPRGVHAEFGLGVAA